MPRIPAEAPLRPPTERSRLCAVQGSHERLPVPIYRPVPDTAPYARAQLNVPPARDEPDNPSGLLLMPISHRAVPGSAGMR
jgi:hypothetical protein